MTVTRRLFSIVGKRTLVTFGIVTFLVAALLATVNITSRYALKMYVEDQLRRIPWDIAVYEKGSAGESVERLRASLRDVDGVSKVANLAFLRARFPEGTDVVSEVGGKPLTSPWFCLLAASDLTILPPGLSAAIEKQRQVGGPTGAVLALVGPERAMGGAFRSLQGAKEFKFRLNSHDEQHDVFTTPIHGVIRIDRDELNRWMMDQTGSVSYIPHVGVILLMPYDRGMIERFDNVATGLIPKDVAAQAGVDVGHVQMAEYEPEIVYLARMDRGSLISGWDIGGSLQRVAALNNRVDRASHRVLDRAAAESSASYRLVHDPPPPGAEGEPNESVDSQSAFVVDSTTLVLLGRMDRIARLIGAVTLLVALPLLWMGWVLAANLSGLLMLNERRKLGLMRLRGIAGPVIGRTFLLSVVTGGLVGGVLGLIVGCVVPLMIYEGGALPLEVLADRQQMAMLLAFLVITLVLAVVVSRRLVQYATNISPLEASARVASSEVTRAAARFGWLPAVSLVLGTYVLIFRWILDVSLSSAIQTPSLVWADRLLDFLGLPLFLYGVMTLLATHREWIQRLMAPVIRPVGGSLGRFALVHLAAKPHRTVAFLLIVALMASVSLYPTITSRSFSDKAARGARVQLGTEWQLVFNAPDVVDVNLLRGGVGAQLAALTPAIDGLINSLKRVEGVRDVTYLVEAVLPNFYLPGYGLRGVPLYLVGDSDQYLKAVYSEPEVGVTDPFADVIAPLRTGSVAMSPPVAEFWEVSKGKSVLLGLDRQRSTITAPASGVVAFLPGIPARTVSDRQGYVQARVDYLNHLFNSNAYVAAAAQSEKIAKMEVLIPRVIVLANAAGVDAAAFRSAVNTAVPIRALEMHNLDDEVAKVGTDMYISLALANMRIYLIGGLVLALVAILSIAMVNYTEDRRTMALLRIRGASPRQMWRFVVALLLSPALLGIILGGVTAALAGFGLANYVWRLREIRTVVQLLPTRLVASSATGFVLMLLVVLLVAVASTFSWWVFRRTAHQGVVRA